MISGAMSISYGVLALLVGAAFLAGLVDSIGGGGGLVVLPALLAAGVPPELALPTNKGQSVVGTAAAAYSYGKMGLIDRARAPWAFVSAAIGAFFGARMQQSMRPEALRPIVAGLLVVAAAVIVFRRTPKEVRPPPAHPRLVLIPLTFTLGVYDGFFGPGVGAMLIVAFALLFGDALLYASANAKIANLGSNVASVIVFGVRGSILWQLALPMALANSLGAAVGSRLAVKRGERFVRVVILIAVSAAVVKLLYDARMR